MFLTNSNANAPCCCVSSYFWKKADDDSTNLLVTPNLAYLVLIGSNHACSHLDTPHFVQSGRFLSCIFPLSRTQYRMGAITHAPRSVPHVVWCALLRSNLYNLPSFSKPLTFLLYRPSFISPLDRYWSFYLSFSSRSYLFPLLSFFYSPLSLSFVPTHICASRRYEKQISQSCRISQPSKFHQIFAGGEWWMSV
jgi:hypothetical protein